MRRNAWREGRAEGLREGEQRGKVEVVAGLLRVGAAWGGD